MTLTTASAKHIRRRLEEPDGGTSLAKANALLAEANRLLDRVKEDRARMKAIQKPKAPGVTRDERRAEHRDATRDLRVACWIRCGGTVRWETVTDGTREPFFEGAGRCEVSGVELGAAWEMHHLDSGGNRRSHQSLDNCLAVAWEVHRLIHRGDLAMLRAVKEACIRLGLRDGLRAIEYRIAKVMEARP